MIRQHNEREKHYHEWQEYLMKSIVPCKPLLSKPEYYAWPAELCGLDIDKGILQSWGDMVWSLPRADQLNANEFVMSLPQWNNLNPLFMDENSSPEVMQFILDNLFWCDSDKNFKPHIAKGIEHITDTHIRITLREGIKWQTDPDGLFPNEYLDAEDVYFTFYSWKYLTDDSHLYDWIKSIDIVDNFTIDFYIDEDLDTPEEDYYPYYYQYLYNLILPEHYLNQTQLDDNTTPDISHPSWETFKTHCFGTGLFQLNSTIENYETILSVNTNSWWLNSSITSDIELDWENRFGTFDNDLKQLRISIIDDYYKGLYQFVEGKIDFYKIEINDLELIDPYRYTYLPICDFEIPSLHSNEQSYLFYNLNPNRITGEQIQSSENNISKGLALRKAISYAINRKEINEILYGGEYLENDYPISPNLGHWLSPDIIKYDYNLAKAKDWMRKTGLLDTNTINLGYNLSFIFIIVIPATIITIGLRRKKQKLDE